MRQFWIAPILGFGFATAASLAQAEGAGLPPPSGDIASCPAAPDHQGAVDQLIGRVQAARDEASAQQISNQFWQYWADAPNAQAQALLDRGMTRRSAFDFLGALEAFDRLVAYCPEYAEGYNQRAFVHYLRRDFAAALTDLDRALALSPRHVAAMSGRALSLYGLSRLGEARVALEQALSLNPWLPERHLVAPGGPLAPEGADPTTPEVEL
ncbi:tetratricopeptide repeat protein [Phaeobacter gallaeciensis]|uniref:Tetratricopeptide repeat protein/TPR repeat protein n=1 Tax=Phaeobacter gallaeciensis TaxID=60890 RepID=A0AAC9Z8R6_9RHOB|nr:tetratricopeptide repeat protein [Phaeobacter gallaeciensis]AHD10048.1 Tetratricopeptide repeat protein/TPR repeat protein [Phaeobacter gallaeciensis DSM 26640]ATE93312.1 Tetratricopeptide repeat protein/TPR repeat protein [Phaeobacter gallaeciensis]ATE96867.1 Tetratricopeptide repeat protein/TPR repeat protein [Phaeobacter gallaeciensis]ATF01976.1 Tetratricopeptide repeat protein/TPR repeat protein [Phaeobacter gallaeciensis]ATF06356.1 Tetratricopeptide repeat protein/TPR repeat protein [P